MKPYAVAAILAVFLIPAQAQEITLPTDAEQEDMLRWISPKCCVTNRCCFFVPPPALRPLGDDNWSVVATNQTLKRSGWSENGHWVRCACDMQEGQWVVHLHAMTRCVFPLPQSARK